MSEFSHYRHHGIIVDEHCLCGSHLKSFEISQVIAQIVIKKWREIHHAAQCGRGDRKSYYLARLRLYRSRKTA